MILSSQPTHTPTSSHTETPTLPGTYNRSPSFTVALHWCSDAPQNSPICSAPRVSDSRRNEVGDEESVKVWWDSNLPTSQTQTQLIYDGWYSFGSTKDKEVNNRKQQQKKKVLLHPTLTSELVVFIIFLVSYLNLETCLVSDILTTNDSRMMRWLQYQWSKQCFWFFVLCNNIF